jgi:hypothetical protein
MPAAQTTKSAGTSRPVAVFTESGVTSTTRCADEHLHLQALQGLHRLLGDVLGETRQDARPGLDQADADLRLGIEALQAVRREHANGVVQLGGELDPCARADDGDVEDPSVVGEIGAESRRSPGRRWKRCASQALSMVNAFSRTPGVPKSFDSLPIAMTSVS